MTNGEKIKEIFPNMRITVCEFYVQVMGEKYEFNNTYPLDWWNAEYKEPTTKNALGVDCISRADAIKAMQDKAKKLKNEDTINGLCGAVAILFELPSVTPQLSVPEVTALAEWIAKLTEECEKAYEKGYADGRKEQGSRWIPVSERLPEEYNTVIASTDNGVVCPEARYSKENGWEWAYESGADYWKEIESDVLAWMPLPKPYKAESEEI